MGQRLFAYEAGVCHCTKQPAFATSWHSEKRLGGFRAYLDPIRPSFLGFPIMISLYKSIKR